jgi:hypothetical protein
VTQLPQFLPLNSVEQYHLADDSPQFPNVISADLLVSGPIDRELALKAIRHVARRHLMTCARLEFRRWRKPVWRIDPDFADHHEIIVGPTESHFIDLKSSAPGQFVITDEGDRTRLGFRIHHAAIDGAGGLQVVTDWMQTYHRLQTGCAAPRPRTLDAGLLRRRNHLRLMSKEFRGRFWIQPVALLGAVKFLSRTVAPIVPLLRPEGSAGNPRLTGQLAIGLDQPQFERMRAVAGRKGVTINEMLLHAIFRGIHQLRVERGWHSENEWIRLVIPMNIRDFSDRRLPAANRATIVQLDRTDRDFADSSGLLWGINYELGNIRKWNLEKTFLLILKGMSLFPGWIRRAARRPVCRATSVVTNLGSPLERLKLPVDAGGRLMAGNLTIDDIELTVPLRPLTPLGFAVVRYGDRQKIHMHFDVTLITHDVAEHLAAILHRQLCEWPESSAGGVSGTN